MGLEAADLADDRDAAGGGKTAISVSCSICLDAVADNGDRSWAKLQCGHQFHLDCIGSAFNVKGVMQCPNCRKIEKGRWLFANGCRSYPEFSMDDWAHDEDLYDLSYTETTSMWCPFGGFTRLAASFNEGEFPTTAYHDLLGQHAIYTEHAATVSSTAHLCPYVAYVQPVHPSSSSSSTSSANVADGPAPTTYNNNSGNNNNNNQWNSSQLASSEMPNSYALPAMDVRYHSALFSPSNNRVGVGGADQPSLPSVMSRRPVRNNADVPRSGSYVHPFLVGQSSGARVPSSVGSSMIHPHPGSAARARERAQALQAYFQQPSNLPGLRTPMVSGSRRSNSQAQMGQVGSSSNPIHGGGVYYLPASGPSTTRTGFQEADTSMPNPFHHIWERDAHLGPGWGFHHSGGGGGSGGGFRVRHGSDMAPSQGHYRS